MSGVQQMVMTAKAAGVSQPPGLTGLIGWWDASVAASLTLAGSAVNAMADQTTNGNNLSAVVAPVYNATGFNSRPTILFTAASSHSLRKTSFPFGTGNTLTAFFVGQLTSSSNAYGRVLSYQSAGGSDADNNGSWLLARESTNPAAVLYRNASTASRAYSYATPHRCIATIGPTGVMTTYVDNVATTGSTLNAAFISAGTLAIGNAFTSPIDGALSEWGVATGFSDVTAVGLLDAFLKTKWGL